MKQSGCEVGVETDQTQKNSLNMATLSPVLSVELVESKLPKPSEPRQSIPEAANKLKDKCYDSSETLPENHESQKDSLPGKSQERHGITDAKSPNLKPAPVKCCCFDAILLPELEKHTSSEEWVLPEDDISPFLLRFPITSFAICLGLSSQAILWKVLATSPSMRFLHISLRINLIIWYISLAMLFIVSLTYALKALLHFEAVCQEYTHPIRMNFIFAPWITCIFLAIAVPPSLAVELHYSVWYVLMTPVVLLEIQVYGRWITEGHCRLAKVANPSNFLSIIGNFCGASLGASMGLKEGPVFLFAVGLSYSIVLFVILYQRLPTNETLTKDHHPIYFLFIAVPSSASVAWASMTGEFSTGSKIAFFLSLFLYFSLVVRLNFFLGNKFSLAWWACSFPLTGAAVASFSYSAEVPNIFTKSLSLALSGIATLCVVGLIVTTAVHAFVLHDLFPNEMPVDIVNKRLKSSKVDLCVVKPTAKVKDIEAQKYIDGE